MKTISLLGVLVILTSILGCKDKNETLELQKQNQSLSIQLAKNDSLLNVYRLTIKDIETALDSIIPADIALDTSPVGKKLRKRLTQKLSEINELLFE